MILRVRCLSRDPFRLHLITSPSFASCSEWPMLTEFPPQFMSSESNPPTTPKIFIEPDSNTYLSMVRVDLAGN